MDDGKTEAYQKRLRRTFEAMGVEGRARYGAAQTYIALGFLLIAAKSLGYDTSAILASILQKSAHCSTCRSTCRFLRWLPLGAEAGYPRHRHALERIVT